MYRLQTVSYGRQGAADDDRHGVVEIARLHLVDDVDGADVRRICEDCLVAAQNPTLFTILPILPMGADPSGGAGACTPSRTRAREKIAVIGGRRAIYSHTIRPGHGQIGRAACEERGVQCVEISVAAGSLKKKEAYNKIRQ